MPVREAGPPPDLDGFEFDELIASGGFADVFACWQLMPRRRVAIKVISTTALGRSASDFTAEANLMASVRHPCIVQVFDARVSRDGRPCLVMELYSGENFDRRSRRERFGVDEVLNIGVRLAAAVETAHRAGVLHRDIKPANVLADDYGKPALTDFGIAAIAGHSTGEEGVSPPWAPPEAFGSEVLDVRSDVYSLAATLYQLLTGRSPFEIPGGDNSHDSLIGRIETRPVPPTGRSDVPDSLERVLRSALAKRPEHRPASAEEFARELQRIETELKLPVTSLELADTRPMPRARAEGHDEDATNVKGVRRIDAQAPPTPAVPEPPDLRPTGEPLPSRPREGLLAEPPVAETMAKHRSDDLRVDPDAPSGSSKRSSLGVIAAAAAGVVIVLAGVLLTLGGGDDDDASSAVAPDLEVNDGLDGTDSEVATAPLAPEEITVEPADDGTFVFSWAPVAGAVAYDVTEDGAEVPERVDNERFISTVACIEVEAIGESGLISAVTRGCAS